MERPASAHPLTDADQGPTSTRSGPSDTVGTERRADASAPTHLPLVELFGMQFIDAPDVATLAAVLVDTPPPQNVPILITPNVDHLVQLERDPHPDFARVSRDAAYVLGDGQPLISASRFLGRPLRTRLAGSELFPELWDRLLTRNDPAVLVCPSEACATALVEQHPRALTVVPPFFSVDDEAAIVDVADQVIATARQDPSHFVFLGVGNPKQTVLAARIVERWPADLGPTPLVCCLGASLEMQVGLKKKAPGWMAASGLEWLYRFSHEPVRLFRRYFVQGPRFFGIVRRERKRIRRSSHPGPSAGRASTDRLPVDLPDSSEPEGAERELRR